MCEFALEQLRFFQERGNDSQHLKDDILGYQQILMFDDHHIDEFARVKKAAREAGDPFASNLVVIDHMKKMGLLR